MNKGLYPYNYLYYVLDKHPTGKYGVLDIKRIPYDRNTIAEILENILLVDCSEQKLNIVRQYFRDGVSTVKIAEGIGVSSTRVSQKIFETRCIVYRHLGTIMSGRYVYRSV
jgi:DNA-directed RNA polymerase specialized sigma subunit